MLNLVKYLFACVMLLNSWGANAGLIVPDSNSLAADSYISLGGYDWTWASTYNIQFYFCKPVDSNGNSINYDAYLTQTFTGSSCNQDYSNQLLAPNFHNGWSFFEDLFPQSVSINTYLSQLALANHILLTDLFTDQTTGNKIQSFSYWNTAINVTSGFDAPFASDWTQKVRYNDNPFLAQGIFVNTIYVRKSQPVPEPSTLFIFAVGLLVMAVKMRTKNNV